MLTGPMTSSGVLRRRGRRCRCGRRRGDAGITAIEYALLAALVAMVIIIAVIFMGSRVSGLYTNVSTHVSAS